MRSGHKISVSEDLVTPWKSQIILIKTDSKFYWIEKEPIKQVILLKPLKGPYVPTQMSIGPPTTASEKIFLTAHRTYNMTLDKLTPNELCLVYFGNLIDNSVHFEELSIDDVENFIQMKKDSGWWVGLPEFV